MKAIIFGANGQDGYYLERLLLELQYEVVGVSRSGLFLHTNITSYKEVSDLVKIHLPAFIFHLAANSTTRHDAMFENHETISTGTLNILEAVKNFSPLTKVFISGSGLQFKNENSPIKESDAFEARDPYSVSRIQSVYAARYFRTLGLKIYVGYFFNHDSPRRSERHLTKMIAESANRISAGSKEKLEIGNTEVVKEYTYAGDAVKAIWTLVNQNKVFESNIGSGKGYAISDWLDICFSYHDLNWKDHTTLKQHFIPDYTYLVSDPSLILSLGWTAEVSLTQLAEMMMK